MYEINLHVIIWKRYDRVIKVWRNSRMFLLREKKLIYLFSFFIFFGFEFSNGIHFPINFCYLFWDTVFSYSLFNFFLFFFYSYYSTKPYFLLSFASEAKVEKKLRKKVCISPFFLLQVDICETLIIDILFEIF